MSVIVKGMDIAFDNCRDCPLFHENEDGGSFCGATKEFVIGSGKPDSCPLEEVITCAECKYATMTVDGFCKYCEREADDCGYMDAKYYPGDYYCRSGEKKDDD